MNYRIINISDESQQFAVTEQEFDMFWKEFSSDFILEYSTIEERTDIIKRRGYFFVGPTHFTNYRERTLAYKAGKKIDEMLKE